MSRKNLKIPAIILIIGLVLTLTATLITDRILTPAITEHDFNYSVTYKLNGEIKTLEGVYKCRFDGYHEGDNPRDRYYSGEYIVENQMSLAHSHTIAEKDGAELYIVILFNDCYLMGDTKDMDYEPYHEEPYLEALDKEGYVFEDAQMPDEFTCEIISWEYPEPIENNFVFSGFSILHSGSMIVMLLAGLLVIVACLIFVKRDKSVPYKALDKISVGFNFAVCFVAIPFIVIVTALMRITMSGDEVMYQIFLCIPALTAFTVAASIALRRNGFTNIGFYIQFIGPLLFFVPIVLESIFYNFFV